MAGKTLLSALCIIVAVCEGEASTSPDPTTLETTTFETTTEGCTGLRTLLFPYKLVFYWYLGIVFIIFLLQIYLDYNYLTVSLFLYIWSCSKSPSLLLPMHQPNHEKHFRRKVHGHFLLTVIYFSVGILNQVRG